MAVLKPSAPTQPDDFRMMLLARGLGILYFLLGEEIAAKYREAALHILTVLLRNIHGHAIWMFRLKTNGHSLVTLTNMESI